MALSEIDGETMLEQSFIWVTFQKVGIHCYPEAESDPDLKDVSFLSHPHRHMFHFKVYLEVFHDNRDIEFLQVKKWLESLYSGKELALDYKSCEMLAKELYKKIEVKYPGRAVKIEIAEDGENGCSIYFSAMLEPLDD
jgi:hypothetical protein